MADIGPATAFSLAFGSPEPPHPSGVRRTAQHAQAPVAPGDRYTSGAARRRTAQHAQAPLGLGGGPAPTPITYLNRGWCTDHMQPEAWESTGAPSATRPGHTILAGSASYTVLP